ncbi:homoprotocatechuate degradation operon regulator HpaR [Aminobacter carboxidus]|nr:MULTISPECIES: homoprotocatechuate degradation operon regulator HpaR [Aminobacter carboxidus group]MBE1205210.1 homoprotocatechuate degradation operon regulator HpaR [Aminobacter carboxidus]
MSLLRAREVVMAQFRPILAQHGVSEQQWRVIRVLGEQSPLDATELAERASILAPSLTRIIKALEERKLITRGKVEGDGRRVILSIAPKGQVLISQVSPESSAIYDEVQRRIGHERYEQLLDLLEGLIDLEKK